MRLGTSTPRATTTTDAPVGTVGTFASLNTSTRPAPMATSAPVRPAPRPLTMGRAAILFVVYTVVFAVGGGLAAGIMAFVFEAISGEGSAAQVYAITFGVTGYIAYKLAQRVAEG